MSGELRQYRPLAGLPFDALLKIFSECDAKDVLNLPAVTLSSQLILRCF